MKKLINVFSAVLVLSTILSSCKKDEDNSSSGYFKMDNTEYKLSSGAIIGDRQTTTTGIYYVDLYLFSEGLELKSGTALVGKGSYLIFEMYSSTLTDLPDGNYVYGLEVPRTTNTFYYADVTLNLDGSIANSGTEIGIKAGTVTIKKSGSDYEITISCTAENGKSITGNYKGSLAYYQQTN